MESQIGICQCIEKIVLLPGNKQKIAVMDKDFISSILERETEAGMEQGMSCGLDGCRIG